MLWAVLDRDSLSRVLAVVLRASQYVWSAQPGHRASSKALLQSQSTCLLTYVSLMFTFLDLHRLLPVLPVPTADSRLGMLHALKRWLVASVRTRNTTTTLLQVPEICSGDVHVCTRGHMREQQHLRTTAASTWYSSRGLKIDYLLHQSGRTCGPQTGGLTAPPEPREGGSLLDGWVFWSILSQYRKCYGGLALSLAPLRPSSLPRPRPISSE